MEMVKPVKRLWVIFLCGALFLGALGMGCVDLKKEAVAHEKNGISLLNSQEYEKALSEFDQAVYLDPQYEMGYVWRGNAQYQLGNYSAAIHNYDIAINLNQTDKWGYLFRGRANHALENYLNATLDYNKAIELDPQFVNAYISRGTANLALKKYTSAKSDYSIAIDQDPDPMDMTIEQAYVGRGIVNYALKNYNDAALDFTKGVNIEKNSPNPSIDELYSTYVWRGTCYMNVGDDQQAKLDMLRMESYPNYVPSNAYIVQMGEKLKEHYNPAETFPTTPSNPAETISPMPNGPFSLSCQVCTIQNNILSCKCPTAQGSYSSTSLSLPCNDPIGVMNCNGQLQCGGSCQVTTQTTRKVTPTPRDTYKPQTPAPIIHPYTYRPPATPWGGGAADWQSRDY